MISYYSKFRQLPGIARNGSDSRPGRSKWPEAETLRKLSGQGNPMHMDSPILDRMKMKVAFPRAVFGLPIEFRFSPQDYEDQQNNGWLYPAESATAKPYERMGSPLILRPLGIGDGSKAVPMALAMIPHRLPALVFKPRNGAPSAFTDPAVWVRRELGEYPNSPITGGHAVGAFMAYLGKQQYRPV